MYLLCRDVGRTAGAGAQRRRLATLLVALVAAAAVAAGAWASLITTNPVSTTIGTTNVTPMWGPQIPKIVYDGQWYYATTLDGSGTQYPWNARIWKSSNGVSWTLVQTLNANVYQPPGLILDSGNRLWLVVPCWTGGECYPGVAPASGPSYPNSGSAVYLVRLQFTAKLGDGSFNFGTWNDFSVRTAGAAERYYGGLAIDTLSRRYIYHAYSKNGWPMYFSSFDTWTNTETTTHIATPGTNEAYLYARVRPGTASGEVWMLFNQLYTNGTSTSIFGVQLWRSTDGGVTWPASQRFMVASCPNPDDNNFCDGSDLVIDSNDRPHVLFFKRIAGTPHLYYWKGNAGSVTLPGSPVDLGAYDGHSQIAGVGNGTKFVFAHLFNTSDNVLRVLRSADGVTWTTETFAVSADDRIYSPNVMRPESGTFHSQGTNVFEMLLSGRPPGSSVYSRLEYLKYTAT